VADKNIGNEAYLFHEYHKLEPIQTGLGKIEGEWSRHDGSARSMKRYDPG
jgi:hypothetical protein